MAPAMMTILLMRSLSASLLSDEFEHGALFFTARLKHHGGRSQTKILQSVVLLIAILMSY